MQFRRYAGVALSLLHCYLASVSAVRANRAKRSVSKPYFAGLTIYLHSGGRRFALDSISRSVFSAPASAFRCPLACFRYIGRGSDTSFFWLCCNNRCASCRWPRTLKRQPGALSASPTCHAGIRNAGAQGRCENVLGNQLRFGKRDFGRETFPHLGFQLMLDTSLARVRQEVTSVCRL